MLSVGISKTLRFLLFVESGLNVDWWQGGDLMEKGPRDTRRRAVRKRERTGPKKGGSPEGPKMKRK